MIRSIAFIACASVCTLALVTSANAQRRNINPIAQPFHDIGVMREHVPPALTQAAAAPYAPPGRLENGRLDCRAVTTEIAALDEALGPDYGMQINEDRTAQHLIAGAVRDAIDLPYRGILRRLSGAEHRDSVMRNAIQAGTVRRAFLKGIRDADCNTSIAPSQQQTLASLDAVAPSMTLEDRVESQTYASVETSPQAPEVQEASATPAPASAPVGATLIAASAQSAATQ